MKRVLVALLTMAGAGIAAAQSMDPSMPMDMPMDPPKKKVRLGTGVSPKSAKAASGTAHDMGPTGGDMASPGAHGMGAMQAGPSSAKPRATDAMKDMAGEMGGMGGEREAPLAPPPPAAFSGPTHAADLFFNPSAMAGAREELRAEQGDIRSYRIFVDRLETQFQKGQDGYRWDAQGWYGGDIDKLWVKTEGSGTFRGKLDRGEIQPLWSHAISPYFDIQAGARFDFAPNPKRTHAALGVQGLMPYSYNVEATLFLSNKGELTARLKAEYDLLITQRLILQPRIELNLAAQNTRELGIGAGLSTMETGLRLRYEFIPEFAPYIGVEYERKVGNTVVFARDNGQSADTVRYLVGLRSWF